MSLFAAADLNDIWRAISEHEAYRVVEDGISYLGGIWNLGIFGVSYGAMIQAAGVILIALILRGLFARWVLALLRQAAKGTKNKIDDALIEALSEPLKFAFFIIGVAIAINLLALSEQAQLIGDNILRSLVAVAVFWALHRVARMLRVFLEPFSDVLLPAAQDWLVKALQIVFLIVGVAAVLEIWGVKVAPLLTGLGIFGVAVALGAQDLFKNLIAGVAVLMERRFRKGDWINVPGVVEGVVEEINFRSTIVRRFDDGPVYVPNANFSDNAVINFSRMRNRRIFWTIGLEYGTSVDQLKKIRDRIEAYLTESDAIAGPPARSVFVYIDKFSDSSIDIMIYCFANTTDWNEWLKIKQDFAYALIEIVNQEGASFAFPSQTIYMRDDNEPAPPVALGAGA